MNLTSKNGFIYVAIFIISIKIILNLIYWHRPLLTFGCFAYLMLGVYINMKVKDHYFKYYIGLIIALIWILFG